MNRDRFKDAPWMQGDSRMCLVYGAGGIGSWVALLLKRAGLEVGIFDYDMIESHNLGGQLFRIKDIGKKKVIAVQEIVQDFTGEDIHIFDEKVVEGSMTNDICVLAFDNMKARYDAYHNWKKQYEGNPNALLVDGRLIAEQIQVFCIRGNGGESMKTYETEHLFLDSEVADAPCTFKQTSHFAAGMGFLITTYITNHIANCIEEAGRQVPFFSTYFGPLNDLT